MHRNRYPTDTRLYRIWLNMRQRCTNRKNPAYANYGGRGISICDEWSNYSVFEDWAYANGYREYLTIDRIDVNGNYCPDNCRWVTRAEQSNNRRPLPPRERTAEYYHSMYNRPKPTYEIDGILHTSAEWAAIAGITQKLFLKRWEAGKRGQDLLKPSQAQKKNSPAP